MYVGRNPAFVSHCCRSNSDLLSIIVNIITNIGIQPAVLNCYWVSDIVFLAKSGLAVPII